MQRVLLKMIVVMLAFTSGGGIAWGEVVASLSAGTGIGGNNFTNVTPQYIMSYTVSSGFSMYNINSVALNFRNTGNSQTGNWTLFLSTSNVTNTNTASATSNFTLGNNSNANYTWNLSGNTGFQNLTAQTMYFWLANDSSNSIGLTTYSTAGTRTGAWTTSQQTVANNTPFTIDATAVPEPGTFLLGGFAAMSGGAGVWWKRRKKKAGEQAAVVEGKPVI